MPYKIKTTKLQKEELIHAFNTRMDSIALDSTSAEAMETEHALQVITRKIESGHPFAQLEVKWIEQEIDQIANRAKYNAKHGDTREAGLYRSIVALENNLPLIAVGDTEEYLGIAMFLCNDKVTMNCLIQEGTGNTIETSNMVERYYPYEEMRHIITNSISEEGYVLPQQYFKLKSTAHADTVTYEFFPVEVTPDLTALFKMPDYFSGLKDTAFVTGKRMS